MPMLRNETWFHWFIAYRESEIYGGATSDVIRILQQENVTDNDHHFGLTPEVRVYRVESSYCRKRGRFGDKSLISCPCLWQTRTLLSRVSFWFGTGETLNLSPNRDGVFFFLSRSAQWSSPELEIKIECNTGLCRHDSTQNVKRNNRQVIWLQNYILNMA